jgi:hypothetical protein
MIRSVWLRRAVGRVWACRMGLCGLEGEGNRWSGPVRQKTSPWIVKNTAIDACKELLFGTPSPSRGMLGWEPHSSTCFLPNLILAREGSRRTIRDIKMARILKIQA